jgi:mRNA interferase RelE/StbE
MYEVVLTSAARRAFARLPPGPAGATLELLAGPLPDNPHRLGKPLRLELSGLHAARRGDYRVIYSIADDARVVTVRAVGHRRGIWGVAAARAPARGGRSGGRRDQGRRRRLAAGPPGAALTELA